MRLKILTVASLMLKGVSRRQYATKNILRLHERGMYQDMFPSNSSNEIERLLKKSQCVYAGFDPTADSLHIGNLLVLVNLLHWQRAGHNVIALIGGATGCIGDPSGKSQDRIALERKDVMKNCLMIEDSIKTVFENHAKYLWNSDEKSTELLPYKIVNNDDWYKLLNAVEFIGNVGRFFRMGTMLGRENVSTRLKSKLGMSYTEFSYMIFQAYDWLHLLEKYKCRFQIGGSDQMGNIMAGHELISRIDDSPVYGFTLPIITCEAGHKFGKTAGNAVWLNPNKTTPFEFYQFFIRTADADVEKLLKLLTFEPLGKIKDVMLKHQAHPEQRIPQKLLADDLTLLVHGEAGLEQARRATDALYHMNLDTLVTLSAQDTIALFPGAPFAQLNRSPGLTVVEAAIQAGCFRDESDARRIISSGGLRMNTLRTHNADEVLSTSAHILPNKLSIFKVGKKNYYIVQWLG